MTRKEPQFGDDTGATALNPAVVEAPLAPTAAPPAPSSPQARPPARSPWLLWLLVLISLAASFGMAFFGLEEAGRYQAALTKSQEQAVLLEETINRLNQSQSKGIGELAQSDAQMRQSLAALEKRLQAQVTEELTSFKKAQASLNQTVAQLAKTVPTLERTVSSLAAQSEEQMALLAEQLNSERTRVDDLVGQRAQVEAFAAQLASLVTDVRTLSEATAQSEVRATELTAQLSALDAGLKALQVETDALAASSSNMLGVELLSEQMERVRAEVTSQGELLQAVDASRRQLTQRLIDLDGRVNLALQPQE